MFARRPPAIFAYVADRRYDADTAFVGGVGDDQLGRLFRDTVEAAGIRAGTVRIDPALPTATARIDYDARGDRTFSLPERGSASLHAFQEGS